MTTIIRHRKTLYGFAVVATETSATGFTARFQLYRDCYNGHLTLEDEQSFSDEQGAIAAFDNYFKSEI